MEMIPNLGIWRRAVFLTMLLASVATVASGLSPGALKQIGQVNGQPLTLQRFRREVALQEFRAGLRQQPMQHTRASLLNRLIQDTLLLQAAREAEVIVASERTTREIARILDRYQLDNSAARQRLRQHGVTWEDLRTSIADYLMMTDYVNKHLLADVQPSEREATLEAWLSTAFQDATVSFDPSFLEEVNAPPVNQ